MTPPFPPLVGANCLNALPCWEDFSTIAVRVGLAKIDRTVVDSWGVWEGGFLDLQRCFHGAVEIRNWNTLVWVKLRGFAYPDWSTHD